jgi:hypothetical protein
MGSPAGHLANKHTIQPLLRAIAEATPDTLEAALAAAYHPDVRWRGSHPMNEMTGTDAIAHRVWRPLLRAFPDLERRDTILIAGDWQDTDFVAAVGHYCGNFRRDWLTIPATGRTIYLRYGEVHRIVEGKVAESTVLIDLLDAMRQAGFWPLAPSLGVEEQWPAAFTGDGIVLTEQDPAVSAASIAQTLAMHKTIGEYDDTAGRGRQGLLTMPQKDYWHPRMSGTGPVASARRAGWKAMWTSTNCRSAPRSRTGGAPATTSASAMARIRRPAAGQACGRSIWAATSWACRRPDAT